MGIRGCVPVKIKQHDAVIVARWLRLTEIPYTVRRPETVLGQGCRAKTELALTQLASILEEVARRKRNTEEFTIQLPRELAKVAVSSALLPTPQLFRFPSSIFRLSDDIRQVLEVMQKAGNGKVGRPKLCEAERDERIAREHVVEDRHRKRLKRRKRVDDAWSAYFKEVSARGETVLTTSIPSPKI